MGAHEQGPRTAHVEADSEGPLGPRENVSCTPGTCCGALFPSSHREYPGSPELDSFIPGMTIFLMSVSLVVATLLGVWGTSRFPRFFPMYFFVLVPLDMLWLNEYYILTYRPESLLDVPIILKVIKD